MANLEKECPICCIKWNSSESCVTLKCSQTVCIKCASALKVCPFCREELGEHTISITQYKCTDCDRVGSFADILACCEIDETPPCMCGNVVRANTKHWKECSMRFEKCKSCDFQDLERNLCNHKCGRVTPKEDWVLGSLNVGKFFDGFISQIDEHVGKPMMRWQQVQFLRRTASSIVVLFQNTPYTIPWNLASMWRLQPYKSITKWVFKIGNKCYTSLSQHDTIECIEYDHFQLKNGAIIPFSGGLSIGRTGLCASTQLRENMVYIVKNFPLGDHKMRGTSVLAKIVCVEETIVFQTIPTGIYFEIPTYKPRSRLLVVNTADFSMTF